MAQVPPAPWSRWDMPGYQYVSYKTKLPFPLQYDTGFENSGSQFGNATRQRLVGAGRLLDQRTNPNDANFVDCIYGIENSLVRVIQRCLASVGCCETSCCKNRSWQEKYAWAIALLTIFCALVLLSLFVTLFCWLYNRARDKNQKRFISQSMGGISPAISQTNLATIENRNESGYYPYVCGPNQY
ncbi:hypothetical protein LOAG_17338 [Loa loa]|uniref:CX domain-containing protein n=1 Tax=Loa loa TaxID=7209 RepID=A0A1I7W2Z4_LOALO|nr:hypothetical protein LOAG_17338 [Loa loa]EJD75532.1 hypothetical protein LOAG_17338 [Loa loa]